MFRVLGLALDQGSGLRFEWRVRWAVGPNQSNRALGFSMPLGFNGTLLVVMQGPVPQPYTHARTQSMKNDNLFGLRPSSYLTYFWGSGSRSSCILQFCLIFGASNCKVLILKCCSSRD